MLYSLYMAFEMPPEQSPSDVYTLIQRLEQPVRLQNAPATNILRTHIEAQYRWLKQQRPTWSDTQIAYALTDANRGLFEGNTYATITETDAWSNRNKDLIPWTEVASGCKESRELLQSQARYDTYKAQLERITQQVERAGQQDPRYSLDNSVPSWKYVQHSRDPKHPNEQLAVRVYLNPKLDMTPTIFAALLQELPNDAYYHMKTNDMAYTTSMMDVALGMTSRMDKIVLYTTKIDAARVLAAVERVQQRYAADFQGRNIPPGSTFRLTDGIGVGQETPAGKESASEIIAKRISAATRRNAAQLLVGELCKLSSSAAAEQSPVGQLLYASVMDIDPKTGTSRNTLNIQMLGLPKTTVDTLAAQPQLMRQFLQARDLATYSTLVQHFCVQKLANKTALDQYFSANLRERLRGIWGQHHADLQQALPLTQTQLPSVSDAIVRAGFALGMQTALKAAPHTSPDFALPQLLELPANPETQRAMASLDSLQALLP